MGYPPVSHILTICVSSTVPEESYDTIHMLRKRIEHDNVIGPAPHAIYKLQDNYRNVMHVKAEDIEELVLLRDDLQQAVVKGCVYFDLV